MAEQAKWWELDFWLGLGTGHLIRLWNRLVVRLGRFYASLTVGLTVPIVVIAPLTGYGYLWPEKVAGWPLLPGIVEWVRQEPVPKGDPQKLSVLVAHLKGDKDNQVHDNILTLLAEFQGVQALRLDRTLQGDDPDPQKANSEGHEQAKRILAQSGASILIWGRTMVQGGQTVPYLLITANNAQTGGRQYGFQTAAAGFELPGILWKDLADILRLIVLTRSAEALAAAGHYQADRLRPFVRQVQTLLAHADHRPGWQAEGLALVRFALAHAQQTIGEQAGDSSALLDAITTYNQILAEWTRDRVPLDWATTQNNLGTALKALGERESDTERLEQAVKAFENALIELTRDRVPLDWAMTQNNLGTARRVLGERESNTTRLEEAVQAFENAKMVWTRDRAPLDWAATQNNLGNALTALGERGSGTEQLEQAVKAFENALMEYTRERVPLNWAGTQNNLGNALTTLGERASGTARLEQAIKAFESALMEWTRDRVPLDWARAQNNLGIALRALGERAAGTERLEQAIQAFENALMERTRDRVPLDWAVSFGSQGVALAALAERRRDVGMARQAQAQIQQAHTLLAGIGHPWASFYQARQAAAETLLQRLQAATPSNNTSPSR